MCEICDMQKEVERLMEELNLLKLEGEIAAREFQIAVKTGDAEAREKAITKIVSRTDLILRKTAHTFDMIAKVESAVESARRGPVLDIHSFINSRPH